MKTLTENQFNNCIKVDKELQFMSISAPSFIKLRKLKGGADAIMVYLFYMEISQYQNTNQIYATVHWVARKTHMSIKRIQTARKTLKKLNMIEDIRKVNNDTKQVQKTYIKLCFVPTKQTRKKIIKQYLQTSKSHPSETDWVGPKSHPSDFPPPGLLLYALRDIFNASISLSISSAFKKLYSFHGKFYFNKKLKYWIPKTKIKRNPPKIIKPTNHNHPKNKKYLALAKQLYRILRNKKKLHPTSQLKNFTKEIRLLITSDLKKRDYSKQEAIQEVEAVLNYYKNHIGDKYCPQAFSSNAFRAKFDKLQNAVERENAIDSEQDRSDGLIEDGILAG